MEFLEYEEVISLMTILLLTSASVERFLEFINKTFESLGVFSSKGEGEPADESTESEAAATAQDADEATDDVLNSAEGDPSTLVVLEEGVKKDRQMITKKFWLQISGCVVGIFLCFKGDLALLKMLGSPLGPSSLATGIDYILTGILIGTGTEPIHALIRFLQAKHESAQVEEAASETEAQPPAEETVATGSEDIQVKRLIDIDYFGGLNPLIHINRRRKANPDMIIYHHTEMHSHTSFEEVVTVFQARGFVTGFHAVITVDGVCHNYCRWDARGIHAAGYNEPALGLAFCGCFDTSLNTPTEREKGIMGNLVPTDEQLITGAKVAALWALLYEIDITQKGRLVPHKDITLADKPTLCPGNQFPYARFETLVAQLITAWKKSDQAQSEIQDFKKKEYLFV